MAARKIQGKKRGRGAAFTLGPVTFRANVKIHFRGPEIPVLKPLRNKNSQRGLSSLKTAVHGWLNTSFLTVPGPRIYTSVVKFYWRKRATRAWKIRRPVFRTLASRANTTAEAGDPGGTFRNERGTLYLWLARNSSRSRLENIIRDYYRRAMGGIPRRWRTSRRILLN